MGERRSGIVTALAMGMAAVMLAGVALTVEAPVAVAKKSTGLVPCPAKVGPFKLDEVTVQGDSGQICDYHHPRKPGWAFLMIKWGLDESGERGRCTSRDPRFTVDDDGLGAELDSASRKVDGRVSISDQAKMSVTAAEKPLRKLIAATEAVAHPCVPAVPVEPAAGLSCPLLLPHDLVRTDWYHGDAQVVEVLGDGSDDRYGLKCAYQPAYVDDGDVVVVKLEWKEGDPGGTTLCTARVKEFYHSTAHQLGYHPVSVDVMNEFVERWDGQALADALLAAAAARTQPCPGAPEGPPPYASATFPTVHDVDASPGESRPTETSIVVSGDASGTPPALGETIELPDDDQHALVVGGPDGEVIREEYIGSQGTVVGFGPVVQDADGNWSVMVILDVSATPTDPVPTAEPASSAPIMVPVPSQEPTIAAAIPSPDTSLLPSTTPAPANVVPAETPTAPPAATPTLEPDGEPTPAPPTGPPDEGAIRNITDHLEVMGEMLDDTGVAEWTIPPSDIEALVVLKPEYVSSVSLGSGSITVETDVGKIHITPIIGESGLVEFRLSRLTWLRSNSIVEGLVRALNAGVADRGGRFRMISVTPEGITLSAEGPTR